MFVKVGPAVPVAVPRHARGIPRIGSSNDLVEIVPAVTIGIGCEIVFQWVHAVGDLPEIRHAVAIGVPPVTIW